MDMQLLRRGGSQVYESSVRYANATIHDVLFNKATYTNTDGSPGGLVGVIFDITERKQAEALLDEERRRLQKALDEVRTLRGIVPICAYCKNIRDDKGYWSQVEQYVSEHSEAEFSHGICPECMRKNYPDIPNK
jgi:hypothetical protein